MYKTQSKFLSILFCLAIMLTLVGVQPAYAATLTVNTLVDENDGSCVDGDCSLRDAIQVANANDTINFSVTGIITLSGTHLLVNKDLTITGPGSDSLTIDGNNASSIFLIPNGTVFITGMTMTNGRPDPEIICGGGAIYSTGFLTLNDVIITNNVVVADTVPPSDCDYPRGGGIFAQGGSLTVTNSTISNNDGFWSGGGIHFYSNTGTLTLNNVTVSGNFADVYGGGIDFENGNDQSVLTNVTISNNYLTASTNYAGGIYNAESMSITNSSISSNDARDGAGIFTDSGSILTISNSTILNNEATRDGGAIYIYGDVGILNSTIYNNTATNRGGGFFSHGAGELNINNSTIVGNSQGGLYLYDSSGNGPTAIYNTIVANNGLADCYFDGIGLSYFTGDNYNLDTDGSCEDAIQKTMLELNLGTLSDNGGSTQTMALLTGSHAINAGNNATCEETDQRGTNRPQGGTCDIGAYEKLDDSGFPTFADVPTNGFGWAHIESIYEAGITGGCTVTPLNYCPSNNVTRAQMAVFLLRGIHGSSYTPPAATGTVFADVPISHPFAAWIEQFSSEGITGGCGGGNYCPNNSVTRSQMAIFLLRAKYGSAYSPPAATGTDFTDVPINGFAAAWIEQLVSEGITAGCGGGNYCPNNPVTRAQMAIFIQRTFSLPLP